MYAEMYNIKNEAIMEAILSKNEVIIQKVLAQFEDFNIHTPCRDGTTLGCAAVKTGNLNIVKMILKDTNSDSGSKSQKRMEDSYYSQSFTVTDPTFYSCFCRTDSENLNYPCEIRGEIFHLDKFGNNMLHYAVLSNNVEMVKYLLTNYVELRVDQCDRGMNTPLHIAATNDYIEMAKILISFRATVDLQDCEGKTPLHIASERGFTDLITVLLDANANINALDNRNQTPLMLATIYNHCPAVEKLIERGAKVNYEDNHGFTALRRAVYVKNAEISNILITNGARICESQDLLHYAAVHNLFDIAQTLLVGGARLEAQNNKGFTPLMVAVEHKNFEMTVFLLNNGANPNTFNWLSGTNSLHLSMFDMMEEYQVVPFLDVLVKHGANMYLKCRHGFDALYYALLHKNDIAACHLLKLGMDPNHRHRDAPCDYMSSAIRHAMTPKPIRMLLIAGFDLTKFEMKNNELRRPLEKMNDKQKCVYNHLRKTLTLQEYCRASLRRTYKHDELGKLPISNHLRKFLQLEYVDISKL